MTIDEIIKLFEEIENGKDEQPIGYHLHRCIRKAVDTQWITNASYKPVFSGFLKALKDHESLK